MQTFGLVHWLAPQQSRIQRSLMLIAAGCLLLNLQACTVLPAGPKDSPAAYMLNQALQTPVKLNPQGPSLSVSVPIANVATDGPQMRYQRVPYQLETFTQSRWMEAPARMLLPLLVNTLESSGAFSAVLGADTAPFGGVYRLDTELLHFKQDFLVKPSAMHIALRAQLYDMAQHQLVASTVLEYRQAAATNDAEGGVRAANEILPKILQDLQAFVVQYAQTVK